MASDSATEPASATLPRYTPFAAPAALIALLTVRVWAMGESYFLRDFLTNFIPLRAYLRQSLAQGWAPFWNPYIGGGLPMLAEPPASALYPVGWPSLLFADQAWAYSVLVDFHLLLGAWGVAWLMRRRVSAAATTLSALAFAMAGLMVSNRTNGCWALAYAWAPWFYAALLYLRDQPSLARAAPLAAVWGLQLLVPEPQIVYLEGLSVLCFLGRDWRRNGQWLLTVSLAAALALLLAGPALWPMLDTLPFTNRGAMTLADTAHWQWHPARMWEWVMPPCWGDITPTTTFWAGSLVTGPYFNFYFSSLYLGVLALPLLTMAVRTKGRQHWPLWAGAALCIVASLGMRTPVYGWLHDGLPLFGLFRYPERLWLLPTLGACLAMGVGLDAWLEAAPKVKVAVLVVPAVTVLAVAAAPSLLGASLGLEAPADPIRSSALHAVAFLGLAATAAFWRSPWRGWAVALVVAFDLWVAAMPHQASWTPPDIALPPPSEGRRLVLQADVSQLLSRLPPEPATRRAVELQTWRPNWNVLGRIRTTNAVSSLELKRRDLLLKGIGPEASAVMYGTEWLVARPGMPFRFFDPQTPHPAGWVEYHAKTPPRMVRCSTRFDAVATAEEALERVRRGVPVIETETASSAEGADVPCQLERLTDASFKVTLSAAAGVPMWVRVSETFLPGWLASSSGAELPAAAGDVAFVSTLVPAGATQVTFRYAPKGWGWSVSVSVFSLLAILLLAKACSETSHA
ncbi:MAG: hypothetical protein K1X64_12310 [Myxococcaceae bacterium]|nr:hypothetical protein [Myxococcaceae bacterium]